MIDKYILDSYGIANNLTARKHILSLSHDELWSYIKDNFAKTPIKFGSMSKYKDRLYLIITSSNRFEFSIYHGDTWSDLTIEFQINIGETDLMSKGAKYKLLEHVNDLPLKVVGFHSGLNITNSISISPDILADNSSQWFNFCYDIAMEFLRNDTAAKIVAFEQVLKNYKIYLDTSINAMYKIFKKRELSTARVGIVEWSRIVAYHYTPQWTADLDDIVLILNKKGISDFYIPHPWVLMRKYNTYVSLEVEQWVNKYKKDESQIAVKIRDEVFVGITINKYQLYIMLEGFGISINEVTYRGKCSRNYDNVIERISEVVAGEKISTHARYEKLLKYAWKLLMGRNNV